MEAELQQTLDELCDDLLRSEDAAATFDQNAILHSLTELAFRFPQAQKILGRSLAACYHSNNTPLSSSPSPVRRRKTEFPVKLSVLAQRFLYRRETAQSTISLLAVLASESPFNQQRIVRSVTGVQLTRPAQDLAQDVRTTVFDAGKIKKKRQHQLVLYALTVPDSVKEAFRIWRKRQRLLQNHRIPSGALPEQGGVPKPCLCNECLGAEQFLPTWQLHFQDLSRWTKDPQSDDESPSKSAGGDKRSSSLTSGAFFQVFLQDFCVCTHTLAQNADEKRRASIYYFVSPSDAESETTRIAPPTNTRSPPAFDPLLHVCAIEIAPDIDVLENARTLGNSRTVLITAHSPEVCFQEQSQKDTDEGVAYESVDRVLLLEGCVDLSSCSHTHLNDENASLVAEPKTNDVAGNTGGIAHFLSQVEEKASGEQATKSMIEATLVLVDGKDSDGDDDATEELRLNRVLSDLDRKILQLVLDFLEDDNVVSLAILRNIMARSGESSSPAPLDQEPLESPEDPAENDGTDDQDTELITETPVTSSFTFQITVCLETQELVATCTREDHEDTEERLPPRIFSASITLEDLLTGDDSPSSPFFASSFDPLALLCIEESELRALLSRCQVCCCGDPPPSQPPATSVYYLRPQELTNYVPDSGSLEDVGGDYDPVTESQPTNKPSSRCTPTTATPIPGLPDDVSRVLLPKLEALVSSHHNINGTSKSAFQTKFVKTLSLIIKSCNTRITDLATSRATSSSGNSEVHRKAGMERCRQCRDLLIQLGKKVKLALEASSSSASSALSHSKKPVSEELSVAQLIRISKLVRRTVAQVQTQSQSVHAWETPDSRVDKLHLNHRVWASGFPDPEFYRERDALARENKRKQRHLNQQLMGKQVKQPKPHR